MMIRWWHRILHTCDGVGSAKKVLAIGPAARTAISHGWYRWQNFRYYEKTTTGWKYIPKS